MSPCRYTALVHLVMDFARRIESMMDAWFSASDATKSPSARMLGVSASFAFHAERKESDASAPTNRARAASSVRWMA